MKTLLAEQRPDGGWAQLATLETDAYATGQALVALQTAGHAVTSSEYQRGVAFLMRTQFPDGSWLVRSRTFAVQPPRDSGFPHGKHQWISAAGTSWATMALSLALEPQPSAGSTQP
jgi:N-acyl-D-amino-acid deacylase